jgi:hypothetical protein
MENLNEQINCQFDKAEETKDKLNSFRSFCNWANDDQILEEVKNRLTDF